MAKDNEILEKFDRKHLLNLFSGWVSLIGEQFFDPKRTAEEMVEIFIDEYLEDYLANMDS